MEFSSYAALDEFDRRSHGTLPAIKMPATPIHENDTALRGVGEGMACRFEVGVYARPQAIAEAGPSVNLEIMMRHQWLSVGYDNPIFIRL